MELVLLSLIEVGAMMLGEVIVSFCGASIARFWLLRFDRS
jgi:hypothetical protein